MRHTHTERERERERQRHKEKQAPRREPNAGLDPGSPGSGPGLKAALNIEPPELPLYSKSCFCFFLRVLSLFQDSCSYASRIMAAFVCRFIILTNSQKCIIFFPLQ